MKKIMRIFGFMLAASVLTGCMVNGPLVKRGIGTGHIIVVNNTGLTITAITVSECAAFTHGFNRLPDGKGVKAGGTYAFKVSAGCWDVDAGIFGVGEAKKRFNIQAGSTIRYNVGLPKKKSFSLYGL